MSDERQMRPGWEEMWGHGVDVPSSLRQLGGGAFVMVQESRITDPRILELRPDLAAPSWYVVVRFDGVWPTEAEAQAAVDEVLRRQHQQQPGDGPSPGTPQGARR